MTAAIYNGGRIDWSGDRDDEGHREYSLTMLVVCTDPLDGPAVVMSATGLPAIGDFWIYGNDIDLWAYCYPSAKIRRHQPKGGEKGYWWTVEYKFSTKPLNRCQDESIEDPLDEPDRISGSFTKYEKELRKDRHGDPVLSSSHEAITGLKRDQNRPRVIIEQNVADLGLSDFSQMVDTVNDSTLWGLDPRCVKLSDVSWERKLYGTCNFYYTRRLEFDIQYDTFDLSDVADMGYTQWNGKGDRRNPKNYEMMKDAKLNNTAKPLMLKDGIRNPDPAGDPQFIPTVEMYNESNFLSLGIPTSL